MPRQPDRPWTGPPRPRCPRCGRPAYAVPAGGRVHLLTLLPAAGGPGYGPHVRLPRGARYGAPTVREGAPGRAERAEFYL